MQILVILENMILQMEEKCHNFLVVSLHAVGAFEFRDYICPFQQSESKQTTSYQYRICRLTYWICRLTHWICRITYWICRLTYWICRLTYWICRITYWICRLTDWISTITSTQNVAQFRSVLFRLSPGRESKKIKAILKMKSERGISIPSF